MVTPSGISYSPATGYTGGDTFSVKICDGHHVKTITIYVSPVVIPSAGVISGADSICLGTSVALSDTAAGGQWRSAAAAVATVSASGVATALSTGTDTIFYTTSNLCGADSVFQVSSVGTIPATPGAISGPATLCAGAAISLTDATTGGSWATARAEIATITPTGSGTATVTGAAPGTDTITYTVTNSCGSADTTFAITVNPLPATSAITGAGAVCPGAALTLTDTAGGGTWSSSTPGVATVVATGAGTARVTALTNGVATITYTFTNSCGTSTATAAVTVNPLPDAGSTGSLPAF